LGISAVKSTQKTNSSEKAHELNNKVELPSSLVGVHDVFHVSVSQLRKCVHKPLHVINFELLDIQANLTYKEL
jgi:hypothetical protein